VRHRSFGRSTCRGNCGYGSERRRSARQPEWMVESSLPVSGRYGIPTNRSFQSSVLSFQFGCYRGCFLGAGETPRYRYLLGTLNARLTIVENQQSQT